MRKEEFLGELARGLSGLPREDIEERLGFYSEMIDDRMEEGLSEEEAVAGIGSVEEIVSQIVSEIPLTKLVKERVKPKRGLRAWEIILLVLGSPVWLSILIAVFAVVFSVFVVLWSVVAALWAVEFALGVSAAACFGMGVFFLVQGRFLKAMALLGAACICAGLFFILFIGVRAVTKGTLILTKKIVVGIKSLFIRKENE